jgi:uncharacterized membrane protein YdjX (TVP38/TMEM64 family)
MAQEPRAARDEAALGGRPPLTGLALTLAGIALLAVLVLAIEPLRTGVGNALQGDAGSLRSELHDLGFTGVLITLGLALVHAVLWYPAEILDTAVGYVYGFWVGLPLVMFGWFLNGMVSYWIGRHAARPALWKVVGHDRFERLEQVAETGGVTLLLGIRLVPVIPFSLFSMVTGAARVPIGRFIWTTMVGYLPITALFVYLGSRLEELSPTDPILWIGAAVMIALLLLTRKLNRLIRELPEES